MPSAPLPDMEPAPAGPLASDPVLDAVARVIAHDSVKVPPIPAVVARLSEHLANPTCEMREVVQLVGTDQALSAHVLRCARSTLLAARSQVTSLGEAVMRVGTNGLFSLAVSFHLGRELARSSPLESLRRDVFRRAAACGEFCRRLAPRRATDPEGAFLCGLLGSFGVSVALGAIEQVLAAGQFKTSRPAEVWMEIARGCEEQIGASVAAQWGMPKLVTEVIAARHQREVDPGLAPYVRLLRLADALTDLFYRVAAPGPAEIAAATGVDSGEAAEIAAFLPEVAASVWALGVAAEESRPGTTAHIQIVEAPATTLRGQVVPASIPVTVERREGDLHLVCVGLAADGFVAHGTQRLPLNHVVKCRLLGIDDDFELVAFVASVKHGDDFQFEMKPMGLSGPTAGKWQKLRQAAAAQHSMNEALDEGPAPVVDGEPPAASAPASASARGEPSARAAVRQGGVSVHQKSFFGRIGGWLRGRVGEE